MKKIPCEDCITLSMCRAMVKNNIEKRFLHIQDLYGEDIFFIEHDVIKLLHDKCSVFKEYFPVYFNLWKILYPKQKVNINKVIWKYRRKLFIKCFEDYYSHVMKD